MFVEIGTKDKKLEYEIMEKEIKNGVSLGVGEKIDIEGMTVIYRGGILKKAEEIPYVIHLTITFAVGVAASYIGAWLYSKVHGRVESLSIDFQEVDIDEGEITKIIEMKIQKKK